MDYKVRHHEASDQGEFYAEKGSERLGSIVYERPQSDKMIIKETNVNEESRHQGIGHDLVNHAVHYAKDKNINLEIDCPFAKSCVEEQGGQKAA